MKRLILLMSVMVASAFGQLIGPPVTDAPQHGFAVGVGVGPTTKDFSLDAGYAEKLPSSSSTYSYSGVAVVPALVANDAGGKSLAITSVVHTGIKQIVFQQGRLTAAIDGGAGVSLPSSTTGAFNFAGVTGIDILWRLKKELNSNPGGTNNYIAISPRFTQLTGTPGGTVVSLGISWVHGVNGAQ